MAEGSTHSERIWNVCTRQEVPCFESDPAVYWKPFVSFETKEEAERYLDVEGRPWTMCVNHEMVIKCMDGRMYRLERDPITISTYPIAIFQKVMNQRRKSKDAELLKKAQQHYSKEELERLKTVL